MKGYIQSIKGMHDILPENIFLQNYIKEILKRIFNSYCYHEIKTPILEETKLFQSAIGKSTDIIEKEMYSFQDKSGRYISLRPEGTIGCTRLTIENGLLHNIKEQKLWYIGPMFRHEKPQQGRYRQFYQIGGEVFGLKCPEIELELIMLTKRLWDELGISNSLTLEINTIGSIKERIVYEKQLVLFLKKYVNFLDKKFLVRLKNNPLRILDSKEKEIQKILTKAPCLIDYLNDNSIYYFNNLQNLLRKMNIQFTINKYLVRGLDYYNDIVFEWKSHLLGAKNTICAGGRYDGLSKKLGGNNCPAAGFAIGLERLILLMKTFKSFNNFKNFIDIGIIFLEDFLKIESIKLAEKIRTAFPKLRIKIDFFYNSIKKKLRYANKCNVHIILLLGSKEFYSKCILIKNMKTNHQETILKQNILSKLRLIFNLK